MRIFFLVFLILIFLYEVLFWNKVFFYGDLGNYFYPIKHLYLSFIKEGVFPLWNPYLFCGTPLLANPQSQILYPPSIFIYIAGLDLGLNLFVVFHLFLSGLSTYLLARELGLSRSSSCLSCLVYTFSGWLISTIDILIAFSSSAWIPLVFYLWLRGLKSLKYTIFTGIAIALQILAGEFFISYITILLLLFHSIYLILSRKIYYQLRRLTLVVLIGIAITLSQLIPFCQFALESTRFSRNTYSTFWSFSLLEVTRFIIPLAFGDPVGWTLNITKLFGGQLWLKSPYLGIIPFMLILLAFKERKTLFFLSLAFISLILSFGEYTPLYKLIQSLPFFDLLRYPVKFISIFTLSGAILSGFGFSLFLKKRNPLFFFIPFLGFLGLTILLIISKDLIISGLMIDDVTTRIWVTGLIRDTFFISGILFCAGLLSLIRGKIGDRVFILFILLLVFFDVSFFGKRLLLIIEPEIYQFETQTIKHLKGKEGRFYISPRTMEECMSPKGRSQEECFIKNIVYLIPNLGLVHRLSYCQGYDPLLMKDPSHIIWLINTDHASRTSHLLSLINTRYIISKDAINIEQFKLLLRDGKDGPFLYENISCLPRAFFVYKKRVIPDRMRILEEMADPTFDPREEVFLEEEPEKSNKQSAVSNKQSAVNIIKYEPNKVVIDVDASTDGFLFLSDSYYPEWKAFVDGKETKIYRANYCFRAVKIKEGRHTVEFKYFPKTFIIGLIGSLAAILLITIVLYVKK